MSDAVEQVTESAPEEAPDVRASLDGFEPITPVDEQFAANVGEEAPADDGSTDFAEETPDLWGSTLPDDPTLPEAYRGKLTVKDLYENERKLVATLNEAGQDRNKLRAQNDLLMSSLQQMQQQQGAMQQMQQQAAQMSPQEQKTFYESIGVDPKDVFDNPEEVLTRPIEAVRSEFYHEIEQSRHELQQLREMVAQGQNKTEYERKMDHLKAQADAAWVAARDALGIDEKTWQEQTPDFVQYVVHDRVHQNPMGNPEAYIAAYKQHASRWGGMPQQAASQGSVAQRAEVVNPPHATSTRTTGTGGSAKKLPKHIEREVDEMASAMGRDPEWVRKAYFARQGA